MPLDFLFLKKTLIDFVYQGPLVNLKEGLKEGSSQFSQLFKYQMQAFFSFIEFCLHIPNIPNALKWVKCVILKLMQTPEEKKIKALLFFITVKVIL